MFHNIDKKKDEEEACGICSLPASVIRNGAGWGSIIINMASGTETQSGPEDDRNHQFFATTAEESPMKDPSLSPKNVPLLKSLITNKMI